MSGITNSYSGGVLSSPPEFDGMGGQKGAMWVLKEEAFFAAKGLSAILQPGFEARLTGQEIDASLDPTNNAHADGIEARKLNVMGMAYLTMSMKLAEMLNMIQLEKARDTDWPSGKFPVISAKIKARLAPDDDVAEMDMEDDLRKIKCAKN